MVAVRQQAIAKAAPVEARAAFAQNLEEQQGVLRAAEHRLAAVAEGRQMLGRAGKLEAKRPCHAQILATPPATSKTSPPSQRNTRRTPPPGTPRRRQHTARPPETAAPRGAEGRRLRSGTPPLQEPGGPPR